MAKRKRTTRIHFGRRARRKRRVVAWRAALVGGCAWSAAAATLVWAIAALWPVWFITDLLAGLAAQGLLAGLVAVIACALLRRWGATAAATLGWAVLLVVLVWSHRGSGRIDPADRPIALRAVVANFYAYNDRAQAALARVLAEDADVMAWVETPNELLDRLRWDEDLRARYPYVHLPDRARTGFPILLSKWPMLTRQSGWQPQLNRVFEDGFLMGVVDHPQGQFALLWASPRSPRHTERWAEGNAVVRQLASGVNEWFGGARSRQMPIIVLGDQNATPTNWRSRYLRKHAGLRRAKPLFVLEGTYPANRRWPLRVAIDDALVSRDVKIDRWQTIPLEGSDHAGAVIELRVSSGRALPVSDADALTPER